MKQFTLNGAWTLKNLANEKKRSTQVPGSVFKTLLDCGDMPDPFYGTNEYACAELMRDDFLYEKIFDLPEYLVCCNDVNLIFEGIDTIACIRLNGVEIAKTNNMHRTYKFNVSKHLKQTDNILSVTLLSSLNFIEEAHKKSDIFYASTGCMHGNGYLRKAHYMFGWDWGPVLPDAGIFKSVYLESVSDGKIEDFSFTQAHKNSQVTLSGKILTSDTGTAKPELTLICPNGRKTNISVQKDDNMYTFKHIVVDPQLWWPNGYGKQPLYTLTCSLVQVNETIDTKTMHIGLRELYLSTEKDEYGRECAFCINGVKIFAMGANYVPQDNIIPRVNVENTRKLLEDCAKANYNCIRVWGGGYYPDDYFYNMCDEMGLIIWQDLMFACNVYDLTDELEENIIAETQDIVRRLRHHACLGLWCGNNEMEWGWQAWARLEGHRPKYKADYIKIFEMILPRCVQTLDKQTSYWLSSPSSGGSFDNPNDFDHGDNHYWEVWHSGKPFTDYKNFHFRFCSEFGFQSFPSIKTIRQFCPSYEENIFSKTMESHQKNGMANQKIFTYVSDYFRYPKNLENIAYISQILQLKAIQYGVEHWRRNLGRCMGSLYWQLNDCWPVASWASIDYYGRWKALHYGAKRFYARCTASACEQNELSPIIDYFVHNELLCDKTLKLKVSLSDMKFNILYEQSCEVSIKSCTTKSVMNVDFTQYMQDHMYDAFAVYELYDGSEIIASGTTLFAKPKHINFTKPNISAKITEDSTGFDIHLSSDVFAHYVELSFTNIDAVLSDNFFDITSAKPKVIRIEKADITTEDFTLKTLKEQLFFNTVANSY